MSEITEPITTTLVQPDTITTTLSVGQGPSGPAGATGPTGPAGATGATGPAGPATTDASLIVSGTLADGRLSSNVAFKNAGNVFTAKQSFSGTNHVGLCLNSLTTAEYNALTATNGDLFRDSTTDRIDARLARGTVELIDSAGGQTINGALTVGGTLLSTGQVRGASVWFGGASQANVKLYGSATGQLFIYNSAETAGVMVNVTGNSAVFRNLANNADAPITCSNLTASGTVRLGTFTVGTLPSASANTRSLAFVTDSNLAFNSTNLGSAVTAGGSTLVPVFSNGTNWVIG